MDAGRSDDVEHAERRDVDADRRDAGADDRDEEADHREVDADRRERQVDGRERVLDRWEREIAAHAASLNLLDELDEERRERASIRRAREHEQRRDDAEFRREATIEREIRRDAQTRAETTPTSGVPPGLDALAVFAQLATAMQTNPPLEEVLQLILAAAVDTLPECAAASLALTTGGRLQPAASTASWAADLDAAQLKLDCGPLAAAGDGGMVVTTDLAADERWPLLGGAPDTIASRGVISVGFVAGDPVSGALTLYAEQAGQFGPQALRIADMLAAHAAAALGRTFERLTYQAQAEAWERALASRDVIGQAKGILMEQRSTSPDEAFHLLREASQRLNLKLRDVAAHVVTQRHLPQS